MADDTQIKAYERFKDKIGKLQDSNADIMKKPMSSNQYQSEINTIASAYAPLERFLQDLRKPATWRANRPEQGFNLVDLHAKLLLETKGESFDISASNTLDWIDWFNFLYACRNVAAHGEKFKTLVTGCLPESKRIIFTNQLQGIKVNATSKIVKDWAEDMLRLLNWMECELRDTEYPYAANSLSYATLLWLPKLSKLLGYRAWISKFGKQPNYNRIGPQKTINFFSRLSNHWNGTPYLIRKLLLLFFVIIVILLIIFIVYLR